MKKYNRKHIGEAYISNEGYELKIVDGGIKAGYNTILIDNKYEIEAQYHHIRNGKIKNLYHKSVFDIGYNGEGIYSWKTHKKIYNTWIGILERCYYEKYRTHYPTYKDVIVCDEWHNFQNFAKWHKNNYIEECELDKDLLSGNNKIYSPETCCFVPQKINSFLANKYSNNTSGYIGVYWDKRHKKWASCINIDEKRKRLGSFDTKEEAAETYKEARKIEAQKIKDKYQDILPKKVIEKIQ